MKFWGVCTLILKSSPPKVRVAHTVFSLRYWPPVWSWHLTQQLNNAVRKPSASRNWKPPFDFQFWDDSSRPFRIYTLFIADLTSSNLPSEQHFYRELIFDRRLKTPSFPMCKSGRVLVPVHDTSTSRVNHLMVFFYCYFDTVHVNGNSTGE